MSSYDIESNNSAAQLQAYQYALLREKRKQESYFKGLLWLLVLLLVAFSAYLLDQRPKSLSFNQALLSLGIAWLGFLPSLQYLADRQRPPMPFFPLVGIFYATAFGLPMFANNQKIEGSLSFKDVTTTSLILALVGIAGMNLAFYVCKSTILQKVMPIQLPRSYPLSKLLILLWIFLLAHIAYLYFPSIQALPSLNQLLDPIGYIAYGMFYIIWARGRLSSVQAGILLSIFMPLEILQRFISGALANLMLLGLFVVLVIWYERKRIPLIPIGITLIFFLALNPVKGEYRNLTWGNGKYAQASVIEKAKLFVDLSSKKYFGNGNSSKGSATRNSDSAQNLARTAHILVFAKVVEDTPTIVPSWNGASYATLFTSFIPRILWADKPIATIGNDFGRRYRLLGKQDYSTSFNLPWMVELYANFEMFGLVLGMPILGCFLAFLEQKLNHSAMEPLDFVVGATIMFRLIYQESNFALMVGGIISLCLSLYLIFKFYLKNQVHADV